MSRKPQDVDQRDFMINNLFTGLNHKEIAEIVGLHRTSIYPALNRFKNRYKNNIKYREQYNYFLKTCCTT